MENDKQTTSDQPLRDAACSRLLDFVNDLRGVPGAIAGGNIWASRAIADDIESLKSERDALREQIKNNPWCAACKESDCCVSGDGTCAMIRKYLSYENAKHIHPNSTPQDHE